jgi:hypothetical protein
MNEDETKYENQEEGMEEGIGEGETFTPPPPGILPGPGPKLDEITEGQEDDEAQPAEGDAPLEKTEEQKMQEELLVRAKEAENTTVWQFLSWDLQDYRDIRDDEAPTPLKYDETRSELFAKVMPLNKGQEFYFVLDITKMIKDNMEKSILSTAAELFGEEETLCVDEILCVDDDNLEAHVEAPGPLVTQRLVATPELRADASYARSEVDEAFGGLGLCSQNGFLDEELQTAETYSYAQIARFVSEVKETVGKEHKKTPQSVKFLSDILADKNMKRNGLRQMTVNPFVIAMTELKHEDYSDVPEEDMVPVPEGEESEPWDNVNPETDYHRRENEKKDRIYRAIIFTALIDKAEDNGLAISDKKSEGTHWLQRNLDVYSDDHCNVILPYLEISEVLAAANKLGGEYQKEGINAFKDFNKKCDAYKLALTYVEPEPVEEDIPVEPQE